MRNEYDFLNDVKMDFSCYEKENDYMERKTRINKKVYIAAACVSVLTITTVFASGLVNNIIKSVSTGYNNFVQTDPRVPHPVMEELKGKIFDENGNALDSLTHADFDSIYDKDGNKITEEIYAEMIEEATGGLVEIYDGSDRESSERTVASIEDAENITVFDIKTPDYLPEGYIFSECYGFADENGEMSGEYMNIKYKNESGKEIIIFERILNEDTAFEAGTDGTLDEIDINGRKAVIMNGTSLNFETEDNVSVGISTKGNVSEAELIKIAESIK